MAQRVVQVGPAIQKVSAGPSTTLRAGTRSRAESHDPFLQFLEPFLEAPLQAGADPDQDFPLPQLMRLRILLSSRASVAPLVVYDRRCALSRASMPVRKYYSARR
jgi:hypothetical protein